jgi:hypothetical protein
MKTKHAYSSIRQDWMNKGYVSSSELVKERLKIAGISFHYSNPSGIPALLARQSLTLSNTPFETVRYGRGFIRFVAPEHSKAFCAWLDRHLARICAELFEKKYPVMFNNLPSVDQDVDRIVSSIANAASAAEVTPEEVAVKPANESPKFEVLRNVIAEANEGLFKRIDDLASLVQMQQSMLTEQSQTIKALKDQLGTVSDSPRVYQPAQTPHRVSFFGRLFGA